MHNRGVAGLDIGRITLRGIGYGASGRESTSRGQQSLFSPANARAPYCTSHHGAPRATLILFPSSQPGVLAKKGPHEKANAVRSSRVDGGGLDLSSRATKPEPETRDTKYRFLSHLGKEVGHKLVVRADGLPLDVQRVLGLDKADELRRADLREKTKKKKKKKGESVLATSGLDHTRFADCRNKSVQHQAIAAVGRRHEVHSDTKKATTHTRDP